MTRILKLLYLSAEGADPIPGDAGNPTDTRPRTHPRAPRRTRRAKGGHRILSPLSRDPAPT